ncbi:DUF4190 domain-containing protein [Microtetraspora niveoalba]|uniref:DUF4190 domain-containing protein n=1 Tax=Microtetraspora niveoalba TaxID=46175 RepID=UPI000834B4A9|nr:DUF4190 domain-containing protein [Microtetraspora niveoalba]
MTTPDKHAWEPPRDQRPDNETRPDEQRLVLPVNSWDEPDLEGSWWEPSGYREPDQARPGETRSSAFGEIGGDPAGTDHRPAADPHLGDGGDTSDPGVRDGRGRERGGAETGEPDFSEWTDCGFSDDLAATDPGYRSWAEPETTWESLKAWAAQDPLASRTPYASGPAQRPEGPGRDSGGAPGQGAPGMNAGGGADAAVPPQVPPPHVTQASPHPQSPASPGTAQGTPQPPPQFPAAPQTSPQIPFQGGPPGRQGGAHADPPPASSSGAWNDPYAGPATGPRYGDPQPDPRTDWQSASGTGAWSDAAADARPEPRIDGASDGRMDIRSDHWTESRGEQYAEGRADAYMERRFDAHGFPIGGADAAGDSGAVYPPDVATPPAGWTPSVSPYPPGPASGPEGAAVPPSTWAEGGVCGHCGMPQGTSGPSGAGTGAFGTAGTSDGGTGAFGTGGSADYEGGAEDFGSAGVATGPMTRVGGHDGRGTTDRPVWSAGASTGESTSGELMAGGAADRGTAGGQAAHGGAAAGLIPYAGVSRRGPEGEHPADGHVHVLKAGGRGEAPAWGRADDDYVRVIGKDAGTEGPEEPQGRPGEYGERLPETPRPPEEHFGDRTPPGEPRPPARGGAGGRPPSDDQPVYPGEPGRRDDGQIYYQQPPRRRGEGLGTAAMVLGIVSIVLLFFCGLGALTAIVGAVLGVVALAMGASKGRAVTGIVLSVLTLVLAAVIGVAFYNWFQAKNMGECFDVRTHPTQASTQRCIEDKLSGSGVTGRSG